MKRLLSLTMAMMMAFSATAFAATVGGEEVNKPVIEQNTNDKYDVIFGDDADETVIDGNEYLLWAVREIHTDVKDVSFTQETVLYINQGTAAAGQVSFTNFLPMEEVDATLLVSGQGMTEPQIVGYIAGKSVVLLGDVTLDNAVNMDDVVRLLRHVLNAENITDADALAVAEVTGNENLNMDDVVKLLRYVLNAIDTLE